MKDVRILSKMLWLVVAAFSMGCSLNGLVGSVAQVSEKGGLLNGGATGPTFDLYFGVSESTSTRSYLKRLEFNSDTNVITDSSYLQLSYNSEIRGMGIDGDGNLLMANAFLGNPIEVIDITDPDNLLISGSITPDHGSATDKDTVRNHTVCVLPNGNTIIGGYSPSTDVNINEYTSTGIYIQNVHTEVRTSFHISMNKCVSRSNNEIFVIAANSSVSGGAKLMHFTRSDEASAWTLTDQLLDSDFDTANATSGSSFWGLAVDPENDYVYVSRYMDTGTQAKKLIRCPATGFNASNCVGVGDDVPSDSRIKSMIVIPETGGDLLVVSHLPTPTIFRYKASDGTWTSLYDLTTMDLGADTFSQAWAKAILK